MAMKKWIFIGIGMLFLAVFSLLFGIYTFLNVPYAKDSIERVIESIDLKIESADVSQITIYADMLAAKVSFEEKIAATDSSLIETISAWRENSILTADSLTPDQIDKLKKIFSGAELIFKDVLQAILNKDLMLPQEWLDPLSAEFKNRPDFNQLNDFLDYSVLWAQWLALKGDWEGLQNITLAQNKLAKVLIQTPNRSIINIGLAMRDKIWSQWMLLYPILPEVVPDSFKPNELVQSLTELSQLTVSPQDLVSYDLYEFDLEKASFNKQIIKEMRAGGLKLPDNLLRVLYIRDKKIGLMKLYQLMESLNKGDKQAQKQLKAFKKKNSLTPLANKLNFDYETIFKTLKQKDKEGSEFVALLGLNLEELKSKRKTQLVIPLSVYDLYSNSELIQLSSLDKIEKTLSQIQLSVYQAQMQEPLFTADLYDVFKFKEVPRGVLIGPVQPQSLYESIGLASGDILIGIDELPIDHLSFHEVIAKLDTNKKITLHLVRQDKPLRIEININ